ncbi:hypothetical protein P7C73_g764, partial [Tremellales sp. Uapishka_1]
MDPPSSSSSSSPSGSKPRKFKLDPMSLLLPHERPFRKTPSASKPVQEAPKPEPGRPALGVRQTSSMGEQSGRKGDAPAQQLYVVPQPPHVPSTSAFPISPPASLMSTPPLNYEGWSTDPSSAHSSWSRNVPYSQPPMYAHQPTGGKARLEDWEIVETLGTGTFGRVLLVRLRPSYRPTSYHPIFPHLFQSLDPLSPSPASTQHADGQLPHFAMKVLKKSEIVRLKQVEHINSERAILERVRHPFVVELYATYQDNLNVYMLLSYIPGGELFSHLRRAGRFSPDVTRFYLASIVLAIEYLHSRDIIYRDLKPENLLLDRAGYLRIADFGFAKIVEDRTFTLCGTPEYLAPEIVLSQGHGKAVDWWALGILAFEMLAGYPPFFDDHPLGIYEKILKSEIAFPTHIDPYAKDLIRGLLTTDRSKRLGNLRGGPKDVMGHQWFAGVDWGSLERKEIGAPIVPRVGNMGDSQNFQRYPPPRPHELPGIFGQPYDVEQDHATVRANQYADDTSFPPPFFFPRFVHLTRYIEWYIRLTLEGAGLRDGSICPVKTFTLNQLVVNPNPEVGRPVSTLCNGGVVLGRKNETAPANSEGSDGNYPTPIVSRTHCQLTVTRNGHVFITDVGSLHGTSVVPFDKTPDIVLGSSSSIRLLDGDMIVLGRSVHAKETRFEPVKLRVQFRYAAFGEGHRRVLGFVVNDSQNWMRYATKSGLPSLRWAVWSNTEYVLEHGTAGRDLALNGVLRGGVSTPPLANKLSFGDEEEAKGNMSPSDMFGQGNMLTRPKSESLELGSIRTGSSSPLDSPPFASSPPRAGSSVKGEERNVTLADLFPFSASNSRKVSYGIPESVLYQSEDEEDALPRGSTTPPSDRGEEVNEERYDEENVMVAEIDEEHVDVDVNAGFETDHVDTENNIKEESEDEGPEIEPVRPPPIGSRLMLNQDEPEDVKVDVLDNHQGEQIGVEALVPDEGHVEDPKVEVEEQPKRYGDGEYDEDDSRFFEEEDAQSFGDEDAQSYDEDDARSYDEEEDEEEDMRDGDEDMRDENEEMLDENDDEDDSDFDGENSEGRESIYEYPTSEEEDDEAEVKAPVSAAPAQQHTQRTADLASDSESDEEPVVDLVIHLAAAPLSVELAEDSEEAVLPKVSGDDHDAHAAKDPEEANADDGQKSCPTSSDKDHQLEDAASKSQSAEVEMDGLRLAYLYPGLAGFEELARCPMAHFLDDVEMPAPGLYTDRHDTDCYKTGGSVYANDGSVLDWEESFGKGKEGVAAVYDEQEKRTSIHSDSDTSVGSGSTREAELGAEEREQFKAAVQRAQNFPTTYGGSAFPFDPSLYSPSIDLPALLEREGPVEPVHRARSEDGGELLKDQDTALYPYARTSTPKRPAAQSFPEDSPSGSDSSSSGPVTPPTPHKRKFSAAIQSLTSTDSTDATEECAGAEERPVKRVREYGPVKQLRKYSQALGLVALGAALGSVGTIAGLMQLAPSDM